MALFSSLPDQVRLTEVGPRDGLQNESVIVDTRTKLAFIAGLVDAGCKRVEITAFVNPRWIPPLADQVEVARGAARHNDVVYAALVPNTKGYEAAAQCGIHEVAIFLAASESHNRKNINCSTAEALARYVEVAALCRADGRPFRGYISCSLGCPYEGNVSESAVIDLAEKLLAMGACEISLGDTIGVGTPTQVVSLLRALSRSVSLEKIALHLHDTRGTALANIVAGLEVGVRSFDSSAGGLGGCPYAPGAAGNVATEDLVYMLEGMGVHTGIDLHKLADVSRKMEQVLGRTLPSKVLQTMHAAPKAAT